MLAMSFYVSGHYHGKHTERSWKNRNYIFTEHSSYGDPPGLCGFLVSELFLAFLCCISVGRQADFQCNMIECLLKPGFALFISMGIDRAFCAAIPVTGSVVAIVFRMGIITACYGMFLGMILRYKGDKPTNFV